MIKNINKLMIFCLFFCLTVITLCDAIDITPGKCGSSNGKSFDSFSFASDLIGLCETGTPAAVSSTPSYGIITYNTNTKKYSWKCTGAIEGQETICYADYKDSRVITDGKCGSSNGKSFYNSPSTGLCEVGTATAVSYNISSKKYSWQCFGVWGGYTPTCYADGLATNSLCGSSHNKSLSSKPTTNLCSSGTPSNVSGTGPWTWTCSGSNGGTNASCNAQKTSTACAWTCGSWSACNNGKQTRTCSSAPSGCTGANPNSISQSCNQTNGVNGACGSANGKGYYSTPTDLCSSGTARNLVGTGHPTWSWDCLGSNGGTSKQCSAYGITLENGACGSANGQSFSSQPSYSLPTLCASGMLGYISGEGPWTWPCQGLHGGVTVWCSAKKAEIENGVCGSANGQSFSSIPTTNLCSSGLASSVSGTGPWTWTCNGSNGGTTASCSANKSSNAVNGVCGTAAKAYLSTNTAFSGTLCSTGTASPTNPAFPAQGALTTWTCQGNNGGTTANCSAAKTSGTCGSSTLSDWTAVSAVETNWFSITYGNGLFVAVAFYGTNSNRIMTSPDGINWTARSVPETNMWNSITYGNGLFVAVSQDGTHRVMTSPDGITWTARSASEANQWVSVTYGNGLFVAVATSTNHIMTSPNGITWTTRSVPEANQWVDVIYANGLFVAVSNNGDHQVMTSPNGITWTTRSVPEFHWWKSIAYGNGLFVIIPKGIYTNSYKVMTSPDGITWTARSIPENNWWNSITYGNGLFVAVAENGTHRVMTSPDGITWTVGSAIEDIDWKDVIYGNGLFVAISYRPNTNQVMISQSVNNKCDGVCGTSNGQLLSSIPTTDLCSTGTASNVSGTGPWTWTCSGSNGGTNASCSAQKTTSTVCTWNCSSWSACNNGIQTRTCTSSPAGSGCTGDNPYPISQTCSITGNVQCGSANNGSFETKPTTNLCINGNLLVIAGDVTWFWICQDKNNDDVILCSAKRRVTKVDGQCGDSNGKSFETKPKSDLCKAGTVSDVYGTGPWLWLCNGINGGNFSVCFAQR